MNKTVTIIVLLMAIQFTQAQDYKFGKVSMEELQETANPQDSEADATVLYRSQKVNFNYSDGKGFYQRKVVHERIKIYNKEGLKYATKVLELYDELKSKRESVTTLKGTTYNLEKGKIESVKLKKDGIFDEKTSDNWKKKKFTLPNVKAGSVMEYKYTIESPFIHIREIPVQSVIPIKKIDVEIKTPEYYNYRTVLNPRSSFYVDIHNSSINKNVKYTKRYEGPVGTQGTKYRGASLNYKENILTINHSNVPALKDESFVDNLDNYKAKILMELNYVKNPEENIESYATSWDKVAKTIYEYYKFGDQLNKKSYYKNDVDNILAKAENEIDKAGMIFNFVKSKVKWNEINGYYTNEGVVSAYKDGSGNVADINLMLISMLKYSGLNANPVLVSTKDNGIPIFPTRNGFNYVLCAVDIDGQRILLDASNPYSTVNIVPLKTLNWQGRLIQEDGSSNWVELVPQRASKENISLNVEVNLDLSIAGKVRNHYTDFDALDYRSEFSNHSEEDMIESLQEGKGEIEISNLEIKNKQDLSKPIVQSYEFKYDNAIEQIGDKLYFSPLFFLTLEENPFKEDSRDYPIDFVYPGVNKYIINIKLPEGYVVESLPQSGKAQFNGANGDFTYLARQNGKLLQFTMSFKMNKILILPEEYQDFKTFYQMMLDKQAEKVVLKKQIKENN